MAEAYSSESSETRCVNLLILRGGSLPRKDDSKFLYPGTLCVAPILKRVEREKEGMRFVLGLLVNSPGPALNTEGLDVVYI